MRFITVRDLRSKPRQVWRELSRRRELIVTSNGKPIAILSATSEDALEESLATLRAARAMRAVSELQKESIRRGLNKMTLKQINAEIDAVRRARRS